MKSAHLLLIIAFISVPHLPLPAGEPGAVTEEQVYQLRPDPNQHETLFGSVGVTGLQINFYKGVVTTVDKALPRTPAAGKFEHGQIITGVNGVRLAGRNPIVILGTALTEAEATDGALVFDVKDNEKAPKKQVKITVPVLGKYARTWPLRCKKSKKIIKDAAKFYSTDKQFKEKYFRGKGIGGALACLFLLSTGDDQYLPPVREYFQQFLPNVEGIGHHTWNNGYNGIACAEYYLRAGDRSVLPILQYYCDNAKLRQSFGCSWGHWGLRPGPGYVSGGLMNPAALQVLTTLLLAKECGVKVDEETLLGSLRFFYRFVGHGTVPYGDHRGEGGLGSNGKDGMCAAAMQVASGARGDVEIYNMAKKCLGMSMIASYPVMIRGHGDNGRGDGIWRGIGSAYIIDEKPRVYHEAMDRLTWFYDLSRRPSGEFGMATCSRFDEPGSGAGVALAYTAPLKTLRITGAPRSRHAKKFALPERLWGRPADLEFLSLEKNRKYRKYGKLEPIHVPFYKFGCAYAKPRQDLTTVPRTEMIKNVYHDRYVIRAQAAKALRQVGALDELEKMLGNRDPRVRRAALDGIIDYRYWFGMGRDPLKTEDVTPRMIAAISKMLADPKEALWVVDGALSAMKLAPPAEINRCVPLIMPYLEHEEWWLRESAFMALSGMQENDQLFSKVMPAMLEMIAKEYHTMPRARCLRVMEGVLKEKKADSPVGKRIVAGLLKAVEKTEIKPDRGIFNLAAEGAHNVLITINSYLARAPEAGLQTARIVRQRFSALAPRQLIQLVGTPNSNRKGNPSGLYTTLAKLGPAQREELSDILYNDYRPELLKRLATGTDNRQPLIHTIVDLVRLKHPDAGWQTLGKTRPADRVWRYMSFDPLPKDKMHPREKKRFRDVTLPKGMEKWYMPDFDDSKWKSGKAPIGIGVCRKGGRSFENRSEWGDGEFLLMRTVFDVQDLDYQHYQVVALMRQGFHICLNGKKIHTYVWWKNTPYYRQIMLGPGHVKHLQKGRNVLAVYTNVEYTKGETLGQADVFLEGLRESDLRK